jgi:arylsulfatase A-like enzyme
VKFPIYSVLALAIAGNATAAQVAAPTRPNIVVILADDMGYSDIGCFGSEINTPNIDRLASGGVRFTKFYNSARCGPSRASLLTGRHPHQAGVGFGPNLGTPAHQGHLDRYTPTLAEALRATGYRTFMSGKWHLGDDRPDWPIDRGFDRFFGLLGGAGSFWEVLPGKPYRLALDDQLWKPTAGDRDYYFTDAVTDHAVEFIDEAAHAKKPFFLYLAYTAPHWRLHARPEDIAKYRGKYREGWDVLREVRLRKQLEIGVVDPRWPLTASEREVPAWDTLSLAERNRWDWVMAVYAAMIDRMDQGIGRVMETLRRLGQHENTLVLFLSDNGACEEEPPLDSGGSDPSLPAGARGSFWGYGPPWANASNTPFRRYKRYTFEGGIFTPLICHWPAGIAQPGRMNRQPGHIMDIMATALDVAGTRLPLAASGAPAAPLGGLSFASVFRGESRPEHPYLFWEHTGHRAVRAGDWKLVAGRTGNWELYNLATDRTELNNRAVAQPDKVRDLAARYDQWADNVGVLSWAEVEHRRRKRP